MPFGVEKRSTDELQLLKKMYEDKLLRLRLRIYQIFPSKALSYLSPDDRARCDSERGSLAASLGVHLEASDPEKELSMIEEKIDRITRKLNAVTSELTARMI